MAVLHFETYDQSYNIGSILISTDCTKLLVLDKNGKNRMILDTHNSITQHKSGEAYWRFLMSVVNRLHATNKTVIDKLNITDNEFTQLKVELNGKVQVGLNNKIGYRKASSPLIYLTTKYGLLGVKDINFKKEKHPKSEVYTLEIAGLNKPLVIKVLDGTGDTFINNLKVLLEKEVKRKGSMFTMLGFDTLFKLNGGDMNNIYYTVPNYS